MGRCRCDACRAANTEYERQRVRRKAYGTELFVDAEPVRRHVRALLSAGYTVKELERLSGVGHTTLHQLMNHHWRTMRPVTRMRRENAEALMNVRGRSLTPGQRVPSDWCREIVRRWHAAGLSYAEISRVSHLDYQEVCALAHGRRRFVRTSTMVRLLHSKDELDARCPRPRKGDMARQIAASERKADMEARRSEAMRLIGAGTSSKRAALAVDVSRRTVERWRDIAACDAAQPKGDDDGR